MNGILGKRSIRQRNVWQLPERLLCPVIGTCLDVATMRALAERLGLREIDAFGDYQLHTQFVTACKTRSAFSRGIQKALNKRHRAAVRRFAGAADEAALLGLWEDALDRGDVPGPLWALATHPRADDEVWLRAYEQVHMLSHQMGAKQQVDLAELASARRALAELRERSAARAELVANQLGELRRDNAALRALEPRNRQLEQALARAEARIRTLEAEAGRDELVETVAAAKARAERYLAWQKRQERRFAETLETLAAARERVAALEAENASLRRAANAPDVTGEGVPPEAVPDDACDTDALPDLRGLRVLCVGGRQGLVKHYGSLVAKCNGEFLHHDGGLEKSFQQLGPLLTSAHVVICLAGCLNHNAYHQCKNACRQQGKHCVMLKSPGVTSFAKALEAVAA